MDRFHEVNRAYLALVKEMAIQEGTRTAAFLTGLDEPSVRRLIGMSDEEIEEIASFGGLLVKLTLPEPGLDRNLTISRLLGEKLCFK